MPKRISQQKLLKIPLIKRQEVWMLTIQGWMIFIILVASLIAFTFSNIHSFLAVSSPIEADVLVVEGWIPDYALKQALDEFRSGSYRQLITTGFPLEQGSFLAEYNNFAQLAAASLKKMGLESEKVIAVPAPATIKDRTYASAVALGEWTKNSNLKMESVNLFTHETHARRSWLLFQKALAPTVKVGIIASQTQNYNSEKWWIYSEGVRKVIDETIAYMYALVVNWKG